MEDKKHVDNRNLDEHLGQKFSIEDEHKWEGQEMQANSDPLVDSGTGEKFILRFFQFKKNPQFPANLSKQEIFNQHAHQVKMFLWKDGLIPNEDVQPRVHVSKKTGNYKIIVLAQPYSLRGMKQVIAEKASTLQDITQHATRRNSK